MKYMKVIILAITGICLLSTSSKATVKADFVKSNSNFALNFFQQLLNNPDKKDKSLIFSPLSIQIAGGLLYSGAEGQTASEILHGFTLPGIDKQSVNDAFSEYFYNNTYLLSSGDIYLANKIYIMNGYTLKPTFNDIAINSYHSDIENVNFSEAENSAKYINKWVQDNTGGNIKDLVQADSFDGLTRMYLVNAVHFKSEWDDKFNPEYTEQDDFYVTPSLTVQVQMMHRSAEIDVKNHFDLSATTVNLKFKNSNLSLFILTTLNSDMPLDDLEKKLDTELLYDLFEQTKEPVSVSLRIPKFEIELTVDLKETLQQLNVNTMFSNNADFSSLLESTEPIMVSDGVHKAYIKIDEEGGEASAASGMTITSRMGPMAININHPFLYFIKSSAGEILFMGRFTGQ